MKILVPTAGPVPAKEKADYIVNVAKRIGAELKVKVLNGGLLKSC